MGNILKKVLRVVGCILLLASIVVTTIFVYQGRLELYGAVSFVRASNVVYTYESWHFIYTNPIAILIRYLMYFSINAIGVLILSRIVVWIMQIVKLFKGVGTFDKFIIVALFVSARTANHLRTMNKCLENLSLRELSRKRMKSGSGCWEGL